MGNLFTERENQEKNKFTLTFFLIQHSTFRITNSDNKKSFHRFCIQMTKIEKEKTKQLRCNLKIKRKQ